MPETDFTPGRGLPKDLRVPERLKHLFRKPQGKIFVGLTKNTADNIKEYIKDRTLLISVGDTTSHFLLKHSLKPDIVVTDGKAGRKEFKREIYFRGVTLKAKNPPGSITKALWCEAARAVSLKKSVRIKIDGEDDLAVLPFLILAPLGSYVLYGQPGKGLVCSHVDKKKRKEAAGILRRIIDANNS